MMKYFCKFEYWVFALFLLLPTYLIRFHIGPIPSTVLEVLVLIVIGLGLLHSPSPKTLIQKNKLLATGVVLFLTAATISIFTSVDIRKAAGEWRAFYIEPILIFFVLSIYLKNLDEKTRSKNIQNYILLPLILSALTTSILCIYQHFTGYLVPYAFWANRETYRVTGWYGFPNAVGLFLAPIIPLSLYLIQKNWRKNKKIAYLSIATIFTSLLAILFAKGSGPLIGVAAGFGVLLLCYKKTRIPAIVFGIIASVGIILLPPTHSIKQELLATNYSGQLRRDIWSETFALLKDLPITGAGIASYEERIVHYRGDHWIEVFHHPHNIFLTIWINTGLLGLIGFVIILVWFFTTAIKNNSQTKFVLASMCVILTMGLVDSPYIKNDLAILFWLLPVLLFSQTSSEKK
jgi:O-antigen ligase